MQTRLMTILCCLIFFSSVAQDPSRLLDLNQKINEAKNDDGRIVALGALAEYYSVFKLESKADSILQKVFSIAELSGDKDLILKTLFNEVTNLNSWSSKETFERTTIFLQKSLQYAQELNRADYMALSHIRLAGIYRKRNLFNEAIQQATQALTALGNTGADSLMCVLYNELGDIYNAKGDAVQAYKNYNAAFDIAYQQKNTGLQSEIYHRFSELYRSIGDAETGRKYLLESLQLNTKHGYTEGLFKDYIDLGRITNDTGYINKASATAEILNSDRYKLSAKRLLYYWYMVEGKNSSRTLNYLFSNPDLVQFFKNSGIATYHWQLGNIYRYAEQYDSALHYYNLAETELTTSFDNIIKSAIYTAMAETYFQNKDFSNAKKYYELEFVLSRQLNDISSLPSICDQLGMLHAKEANFKMAYYYAGQADSANKLLQVNAAKDKVVLLQVERENKKRASDLQEAAQKKQRKYNLQVMAITILIAGIFSLMLLIGMFAVSKTTIKMLGYFAFISLFEFIVLVLDHPIIALTHGEPLKIWGIKILLIALLVPFQHFLEHRLIKYLQSRKLLEARQRFSWRNWLRRLKKPAPVEDAGAEDIEEDTAVL
jgi:tetratricopeptide (TPR) repeat protein